LLLHLLSKQHTALTAIQPKIPLGRQRQFPSWIQQLPFRVLFFDLVTVIN
jgi:hypothetical protein